MAESADVEHYSDIDNEDREPSAKKRRFQTYRSAYSKTWPFVSKSKQSDCHVFCKICDTDISIRSGGGNDIARHVKSSKHVSIEAAKKNSSITSFFSSASTAKNMEEDQLAITNAEVKMCEIIVHHNLSLASADTLAPGFKQMFPDSKKLYRRRLICQC
jgi:hypothetical protein